MKLSTYPQKMMAKKPASLRKIERNQTIVELDDGSIWQIDAFDRINTELWIPVSTKLLVKSTIRGDVLCDVGKNKEVRAKRIN